MANRQLLLLIKVLRNMWGMCVCCLCLRYDVYVNMDIGVHERVIFHVNEKTKIYFVTQL